MKKLLSVILAAVMLFSCVAMSASALGEVSTTFQNGKILADQVAIALDFNSGSARDALWVYNNGVFAQTDGVTGVYYCLPKNETELKKNTGFVFPVVTAQEGLQFTGWRHTVTNKLYAATDIYIIPEAEAGTTVQFIAEYTTAAAEGDTLATILNVLVKIFGSVVGFIMFNGDTVAGQAYVQNLFGDILG